MKTTKPPPMRIAFKSYDEIALLSKLKKNKWQRNKHPKEQLERLAKIMLKHGVRHPIHISKRSGQVCFGHGRWEAAKLNGWTSFPVVFQDFKSDEEEFSCVQSDNAIAHWAELDLESLKDDLNSFDGLDVDLLGIHELDISEKPVGKTDPDSVPELAPAVCKPGDIWKLGRHRLMCGDSTAITDVEKLMGGALADLWIADPPFGVSYMEKNAAVNGGKVKNQTGKEIKSDTKSVEELCPFWRDVASNAYLVTTDEAANYWCACQGSDKMMMMMMMMMDEAGWNIRHELVWVKNSFVLGRSDYHYRHEPIIYGWKKKGKHNWYGDRKQDSVIELDRPRRSDLHPTTKPVRLFEIFFANSSKANDLIFESFGGSGTSIIASEKLGRRCNTMELDPHYCDVIIKRWEDFTGEKAEKLDGSRKSTKAKEKTVRRKKAR